MIENENMKLKEYDKMEGQVQIAITILWKILYYQGHYTVTLHSTKCASFEYGDCII